MTSGSNGGLRNNEDARIEIEDRARVVVDHGDRAEVVLDEVTGKDGQATPEWDTVGTYLMPWEPAGS